MPRPKPITFLTFAPANSVAGKAEVRAGIDDFIEWANRARTGQTLQPAGLEADKALTAFSEGRFQIPFSGLDNWAVLAGLIIRNSVRDGDWHLRPCPFCARWLLAKDRRRHLCSRRECRRTAKKLAKRRERAAPSSRSRRARARRPF